MSIIPENFARPHGAGRHATGLLLAFIPGFGQFYHRQWLKGSSSGTAGQFSRRICRFSARRAVGLVTLGEEVPRDNSIFLLAEGSSAC